MPNQKKENPEKIQKKEKKYTVMAEIIRQLRKAHCLTQDQTADILKIKRSTYAYYEKTITPTVENIKKLSTLFDVSVHYLMYGKEDPHYDLFKMSTPDGPKPPKVSDLKEDERLLIFYYRLLNGQNKEKIYKELKDLSDKQN